MRFIFYKILNLVIIFFAFLFLSLLSGCEQKRSDLQAGLNDKLNFNQLEYQTEFKNLFTAQNNSWNNIFKLEYFDTLRQYYAAREFKPLFVKDFEEKMFIDSLLIIFRNAVEHGLEPAWYNLDQIRNEFVNITKDGISSKERHAFLARTELLVCNSIIKYSSNMRYGVLNPNNIFLDSYYIPIPDSSKREIFEPLSQKNIIQYLVSIQPRSKKYTQLQAALKQCERLNNQDWKKIPVITKKIKLGDSDSSLIQIIKRLIILGFADSSYVENNYKMVYDSVFTEKVRRFQKANGLIDDGVINKSTIEKLNTTPKEYINKIKVNLERLRWFDYSDTSRYILVNIPDFKLYIFENGSEVLDINVCTGRKRYPSFEKKYLVYKQSKQWWLKPEDWETPVLFGHISHLVLNPTWTVPKSIMREEIATKVKRDSTYLKKANFRVYKNGSQINPSEVKVSELSSGSIPYTIIQNPGAGNALGKIKFMFDNPFGVYLHDTPTRAPFKYENRAVSHGCVRVEKPLQLAEYLLTSNSKWTIDYLKIEIGNKIENKASAEEFKQKRNELRKGSSYGVTTEVKLDKPVPLFIDYHTVWVDKDGIINFRNDVYKQDKVVLEELFK